MAIFGTKSENAAVETMRPHIESKIIIAISPEELQRQVNDLLTHFDLYDINNSTIVQDGRVQWVAYVYGREREQ